MLALLCTLLLGATALGYVAWPILRRSSPAIDDEAPVDTLRERQESAVAALRELDYERDIGKLDDSAYFALRERYARQAMALLKVLEQRESARDQALERAIAARRAGQRSGALHPAPQPVARRGAERRARGTSSRWLLATGSGALALILALVLLLSTIHRGTIQPVVVGNVPLAQPRALAFDPDHAGRLLAAGQEGVAASDDGGAHWTPLGNGLPAGAISALFPGADGSLEAIVAQHGLLRSTDGGATWGPLADAPLLPGGTVAVAVVVAQPPLLFAATPQGVEETADNGRTWGLADGFVNGLLPTRAVRDVAYAATADRASLPGGTAFRGLLLAATDRGLFASTDGGQSWFARALGGRLVAVASNPAKSAELVVLDESGRLYRSQDGGNHWGR